MAQRDDPSLLGMHLRAFARGEESDEGIAGSIAVAEVLQVWGKLHIKGRA